MEGGRPLHLAAAQGRAQVVRLLIEAGADVNARAPGGMTPLFHAAALGHTEALLALVAAGADLEAAADVGPTAMTAIEIAAFSGHMGAVAALAAARASLNRQAQAGLSCLHHFCHKACNGDVPDAPERLRQLLAAGASVQLACARWPTPVDMMLRFIKDPTECRLPAYVPELIR